MNAVEGYNAAYALMGEIYKNFSEEHKQWFIDENPLAMHHTLGSYLRNHCHLWEIKWEPVLIDGVDHAPDHPDAISSAVIQAFQDALRLAFIKENS